MKKLITLLLLSLSVLGANAQTGEGEQNVPTYFPTKQRTMLMEMGAYTCDPCYTWAHPTLEHFKGAYGDSIIICKAEVMSAWPYPLYTNLIEWYFPYYMCTPFGWSWGTPSLWLNQNYHQTLNDDVLYRSLMHNSIDSSLALPIVASPVYTTNRIGTDSLVVNTYTKFLQNTSGNYRVTVLLLEDSIYYMQTGAATGWMYHMNVLKGPDWSWDPSYTKPLYNGMDSLTYTLANGSIANGTILSKQFRFKLDTTQHMNHIRPLMLVTRYDTAAQTYDYSTSSYVTFPRDLYVNATEKEYDTLVNNNPIPSSISGTSRSAYEASIYPNPATDGSARVHLKDVTGAVYLTLYDALGRAVMNQSVKDGDQLPLRTLASATYTYRFTVDGKTVMQGSLMVNN